jgi:hypothetical protein
MNILKALKQLVEVPNKPEYLTFADNRRDPNKEKKYTWNDWHRDAKIAYPVRYFLSETIPREYNSAVVRKFLGLKDYLLYSYHPKHKHHLLDLRQPNKEYSYGWIDGDKKILYSVFNILVAFIETEHKGVDKYLEFIGLQESFLGTEHEAIKEYNSIYCSYLWWKYGRPLKVNRYEKTQTEWCDLWGKSDKTPEEFARMDKLHANLSSLEKEIEGEETKFLTKVINARKSIWK